MSNRVLREGHHTSYRQVDASDAQPAKNSIDVHTQLRACAAFKARTLAQRRAAPTGQSAQVDVRQVAAEGVRGGAAPLPYLTAIQRAFGRHDVSGVEAYVGGPAKSASEAIGAEAYATGDKVAFRAAPSLHTAAHEAAHVVQQRHGVTLADGVGRAGDAYELHADRVADAVVSGGDAEAILDEHTGSGAAKAVQRKDGPVSQEGAECADQATALDGQQCAAPVPLDVSDPSQPADVDRIRANTASVKRALERLRDDAPAGD